MDFRSLDDAERRQLIAALAATPRTACAILTDDGTRFTGTAAEVGEDEAIRAIQSVPCHY